MCGIIGIVGAEPVAERLVDGLRRMEYRGYDSAGICTLDQGELIRRRAEGKLNNLVVELAGNPAPGDTGIAHTRWATHGAPTAQNAHPHATGQVALVHNGIIENYKELRAELRADGRTLESDTDSEVVAHLVSRLVETGSSPQEAVATVLPRLRGAFALAIAFRDHPDLLIGARRGSPHRGHSPCVPPLRRSRRPSRRRRGGHQGAQHLEHHQVRPSAHYLSSTSYVRVRARPRFTALETRRDGAERRASATQSAFRDSQSGYDTISGNQQPRSTTATRARAWRSSSRHRGRRPTKG